VPRKCSICTHPKKRYINRALLSGKKSIRQIARQYGLKKDAVRYHKRAHLIEAMKLARKNREIKEGKTGFEQFNEMVKEAEDKYRGTTGQLQVGWFREWRAMLELAFKLGIEEERRRERQIFKDVTPGVLQIIEKEFGIDRS